MNAVRLPDGFLDELKARLRPSDVIGKKVKLQKRGKEWVGLSPFTNEKTPSFYVNDAKRMFKCFSSGLGGDVIKFVQETERLSFMEAVERLAEQAGLALPTAAPEERARYDRLARLKAACTAASAFFEDCLRASDAEAARAYLAGKRGLEPEAWARHRLGYAPNDWRALISHLSKEGFSAEEVIAAGLAKTSEKAKDPYDLFRDRIMFPIADARGDVIAFGGRALDPSAPAKYMNSPETDLFHKGRVLYRYKDAKASLDYGSRGGLLVCEGYMDAIALAEAGIPNAVAPLGTALTEEQLSLVWKAGPDPILCFDGDGAGLRAAYRALDVALPHLQPDKSIFFSLLPDRMDPDDLIRAKGAEAMRAELDAALPLVEMLWRRERDAEPLDTPERKAGLEARLEAAAGRITHPAVRAAYIRDLRRRQRDFFWEQGSRRSKPRAAPANAEPLRKAGGLGLLALAADNPVLVDRHGEELAAAMFPDETTRVIRDSLLELFYARETVDRSALSDHLAQSGRISAARLLTDYPQTAPIDADGDTGREWLIALEHFAADDAAGPSVPLDDEPNAFEEAWRRSHQNLAARRALKARLKEAD